MIKLKIAGIISFIIGVVLVLGSFSGITGFVVLEDVSGTYSGMLSVIFILCGILLYDSNRS
jgi:hypothetical protein